MHGLGYISKNVNDLLTVSPESLNGYGDVYTVTDLRKRGRKEPGELSQNKNLDFVLEKGKKIYNPDAAIFQTLKKDNKVNGYRYMVARKKQNGSGDYVVEVSYFDPEIKNKDGFVGHWYREDVVIDLAQLHNAKYDYSFGVESYSGYVSDNDYKKMLTKALRQIARRKEKQGGKYAKYFAEYYGNPTDEVIIINPYSNDRGKTTNSDVDFLREIAAENALGLNGLGAPGDSYIITDTRSRAKKDLDALKTLQKFDIKPYDGTEKITESADGFVMLPVTSLRTDTKNFQNREDEYSETSVNRIIDAVEDGEFEWAIFDPITVWKNPSDNEYYILSGHSRSEAFRRLALNGKTAQGRDFTKIPAKVFKGTFADAKELALNSNTLSTKETDLERANYYRDRRAKLLEKGWKSSDVKKTLLDLARKNEGKNANRIFYLSYLTPHGVVSDGLKNLQNSSSQDRERMLVVAEWIGHLLYQYPQLTPMHETELYRFLVTGGHYGADVRNFNDFAKRISAAIEKNTEWGKFDAEKSLNLERNLGKSDNEKRFDAELARLQKEWKDADELLTRKLSEFKARQKKDSNITDAQIVAAVRPYKDAAIIAKGNYLAFRDKRGDYLRADDKQLQLFGLGKPTIKFEFETNDELKKFLNENKENLIDSYIDVDFEDVDAKPKATALRRQNPTLDGMPGIPNVDDTKQPAAIFNCPESMLQCQGFKPTYKKLPSYDALIDTSDGLNKFVGRGFEKSTLECLQDTCKRYYKQVERLAKHLQASNYLQTAFNIWHWLHCNVRYNYDAPGKEEIRTPARVWADRYSGVDCDCLAVFTACLLLNLGETPKFEIVAFAGKDKYSHIFVNLNGVCIDRVLPVFMQRAPLISKTMIMDIPVYQLSGVNADAAAALRGVYENTYSKIFTHTATPEDVLNFRKAQVMVSLQGCDYNGYRLAGLLMPYVKAIDPADGSYLFEDAEMAQVAADADAAIRNAEIRGASDAELNGLFKAIKKGVSKVAKSVGNAVKSVAKGTANVVKSAVKSTVNTVKATGNLVKAGAQAVTGNTKAAKTTLKKAGSQAKAAIVDPVKTGVKVTVDITKNAVINPIVETVKIAGKLFKVILIKINPVTVLLRNSLRLLVAINFLGMASRMNVANMTKDAAIKAGYTEKMWEDAKKAKSRVVRFFTKMGGKAANIEKAIVNGAKKKPLFRKNYKPESKIVETGDDNAVLSGVAPILNGIDGLGEGVTIGSALAAVGAFIAKIWGWIKNIVAKAVTFVSNNKDKITTAVQTVQNVRDIVKGNKGGGGDTSTVVDVPTEPVDNTTTTSGLKMTPWLIAAGLAAGVGIVALSGGKKKRKKR